MQGRTEFGFSPAIAALTLVASAIALASAGNAAPAETCLKAPQGAAPQGSHWYYRLERPSQRKCWYLADKGRKVAERTAEPTAAPVEQDEEADAPAAPMANAPTAPAAAVSPAPAAALQPVITTLVTRNVSNANQIAQTPEAVDSAQPPAAPSSPTPTVATEAPALLPEQASNDRQSPTVIAQQPTAQPTSTPAAPPPPADKAASVSAQPMPTLQLVLGAIALLGFLASAAFFIVTVLRRRRDVLHVRRRADALPFEESPDMAATHDGPTFEAMPALDPIRRHDDVDDALRRMARRRRAIAAP